MFVFVDFETNGLNGNVTEAFAIDENGKPISSVNLKIEDNVEINQNFGKFMNDIISDDSVIIFWHNYFPIYLSKYYPIYFSKMKGNFVSFIDFFAIFDGLKQPKYKIQDVTYFLTGRDHKGNAKDDCYDLYECFNKTR